jgi:hypothetical protein
VHGEACTNGFWKNDMPALEDLKVSPAHIVDHALKCGGQSDDEHFLCNSRNSLLPGLDRHI